MNTALHTPNPYDGGTYLAYGEIRGISEMEWQLLSTGEDGHEVEAQRIGCTFIADNGLQWRCHVWDHVPAFQPLAHGDIDEGAYVHVRGTLAFRKPKTILVIESLDAQPLGLPESPLVGALPAATRYDTNIAVVEGEIARGKTPPRSPADTNVYVVNFILKTTTQQYNREYTHYVPCEAWGTREQVNRIYQAPEASRWRVIGNIKTRRYDAPDGEIQKHTRIYCHRWTALEGGIHG